MGAALRKDQQVYLAGPFFNAPQIEAANRVANICAHHNQPAFSPLLAGGGPLKGPDHALEVYNRNCREIVKSRVVLAQLEWLMPEGIKIRAVDKEAIALSCQEGVGHRTGERVPGSTLLPEGSAIAEVRERCTRRAENLKGFWREGEEKGPVWFHSPALNIPDSGTVWEVGYAACLREVRRGSCGAGEYTIHTDPDLGTECCVKIEDWLSPVVVAYTTASQSTLNLMLARSCQAYLQGWDQVEAFIATGVLEAHQLKFQGREL